MLYSSKKVDAQDFFAVVHSMNGDGSDLDLSSKKKVCRNNTHSKHEKA